MRSVHRRQICTLRGKIMNTRKIVLAMEACPLEVDEIRRILKRRNLFSELYYQPTAISCIDFRREDVFGNQPPRFDVFKLGEDWEPLLIINPTSSFEGCEDMMVFDDNRKKYPFDVIHGNQPEQPSALMQICAEFDEFPERRQQLIAHFAKNRYSLGDASDLEKEWLFSRNYRLQGITQSQEENMRTRWAQRGNNSVELIYSWSDNCTPFFDWWFEALLRGSRERRRVYVIASRNRTFILAAQGEIIQKISDAVLYTETPFSEREKLLHQLVTTEKRRGHTLYTHIHQTYPGGLPYPEQLLKNPEIYYLEFRDGPLAADQPQNDQRINHEALVNFLRCMHF